jgi:hypothetical protein
LRSPGCSRATPRKRSIWRSGRCFPISDPWVCRWRCTHSDEPPNRRPALAKLIDDHGAAAGYQVAEVCAWRGEVSRAFEWLEKAYAARDPGLSHTATDPLLKPLHGQQRWRPFVQKMGLG